MSAGDIGGNGGAREPAQVRAIEAPPGPTFVIAGPGAGKTYCLIERIAHVIDAHGARPDRICAVTFTNKAAEEIVGRLRGRLGPAASDITVGTLHARASRILRQYATEAGLKIGFGIADEEYQRMLLRRFAPAKQLSWLLGAFSRSRFGRETLEPHHASILEKYRAELEKRGMVDFDDLVLLTAELFRHRPDIAGAVAARWDWLLVDEFQDLNEAQYAIIAALARGHRRVFAVGDDEQAIYGFQGADPKVIGDFLNDFREAEPPIVLDRNHRCARHIFQAARAVLGQVSIFEKQLEARRESPHPIRIEHFADERAEADWVVGALREMRDAGLAWGDTAVLYRTHAVGATLEARLIGAGIPCRLARGHSVADDPVIRYVVAALGVLRRPEDDVAKDRFARAVMRQDLFDDIKLLQRNRRLSDVLAAARLYAKMPANADADRRRARHFYERIRNLRPMERLHRSLDTLIDDLLAQRTEPHNVLEKHGDRIGDPMGLPAAVALAEAIGEAVAGQRPIVVRVAGGLGIPLWTMLNGGRLAPSLAPDDAPLPGDALVLDPRDRGGADDPLVVFKALQIVRNAGLADAGADYVAFDLETTDLDVANCGIIEIAAIRVRDGRPVAEFHALVRSAVRMSAGALATHGITGAELAGARGFEEVWREFRDFVGDDVLVGHNALGFDARVLHRHASCLPGGDTLSFYDTLPLARTLLGASMRLEALAIRFGIEQLRFHRALDDTRMLVAIYEELRRLKVARARRTSLVHLLDDLGVALAIDDPAGWTEEHHVLLRIAAWRTLGSRGTALDRYAAERTRLGLESAPSPEEIVEKLGGESLAAKARTVPDAATRYPEAVQRLRMLVSVSAGATLVEQIDAFLERVALSKSEGTVAERDRVNLLTLHATKGLEFDSVLIVGVEDAQMLGGRDANREEQLKESRRLLYVGMTRARNRLGLTTAERRNGEPGGGTTLIADADLATPEAAGTAPSPSTLPA